MLKSLHLTIVQLEHVMIPVIIIAKKHVKLLVHMDVILLVWEIARSFASTLVQAIALVHVLAHQWDHIQVHPAIVVRNVRVHAHLHVRVVVAQLVKMAAKTHVLLHAKVVVIRDVAQVAILDARALATAVVQVRATLVVKKPVKMHVKGLAQAIAREAVFTHVKIPVKVLV